MTTAGLHDSPATAPAPAGDREPTAAGLSSGEAAARLLRFGPNALPEPERHPVRDFLRYFRGPIPGMIEAAAVLSAAVRHWPEFGIIMVLLVANAVIGFWEEFQAGNALEALKSRLAPRARVRRDGRWTVVPARELVPGDLVRLRLGDIAPADATVRGDDVLEVDQSALTGESLPVPVGRDGTVHAGAVIRRGEAEAEVTATGADTFFGRTARLVEERRNDSHFQQAVLRIGDFLVVIALALVVLIVGVALFRGDSLVATLQFALVLTVAAIPVALPAVLSVTMAVGARLLSAKQAVVTRLAAIEELAGVDVLCSDKTGTLTLNKLSAGDPVLFAAEDRDDLLAAAALASREEDHDPIDEAILAAVADRGAPGCWTVQAFTPFDPVAKRAEARVAAPDGAVFQVSKGAPQVILRLADEDEDTRGRAAAAVTELAGRGFRALGVARTDRGGRWRFLGLIPLLDPPRPDSQATIAAARGLGVDVKMATGDQLAIGRETARQVGLGTNLLDASLFGDTAHHEGVGLADAIEHADGFAEVFPEHKHHIVDVLQARGHIVGMTGDGVNDAPALRRADVGIAVSGATDVARAAADIVLLAPGLSVIVDALRESRRIFQRMRSYAVYRIAETIRVLLFMTLSILVFRFYPVTAVMIVLLALLNDGAILSIAYDHAEGSPRPVRWQMPEVLGVATVLGLLGVVETFGLFYLCERVFHVDRDLIRTLIYLKLSVAGHLTVFAARTRGPFWSSRPSRALLGAVVATQLVATVIAAVGLFMTGIGWLWALGVWGYALAWFLVEDRLKLAAYAIFAKGAGGLLARPRPART